MLEKVEQKSRSISKIQLVNSKDQQRFLLKMRSFHRRNYAKSIASTVITNTNQNSIEFNE